MRAARSSIFAAMYTIYVHDSPLVLAPERLADAPELTLRFPHKHKQLLQVIGTLEGGKHPTGAHLICGDVEEAFASLRELYAWVPAAGGAVRTPEGALLCIHRRGSWDLPKGKIDEGESREVAAVREVEEETGVRGIRLTRPLSTSYHTYRHRKGHRVLKPTYWFAMEAPRQDLIPQTEEDIERAEWIDAPGWATVRAAMYSSLRPVFDEAVRDADPAQRQ